MLVWWLWKSLFVPILCKLFWKSIPAYPREDGITQRRCSHKEVYRKTTWSTFYYLLSRFWNFCLRWQTTLRSGKNKAKPYCHKSFLIIFFFPILATSCNEFCLIFSIVSSYQRSIRHRLLFTSFYNLSYRLIRSIV